MLKLNIKTEPYWLDLPSKVKLKVKPVSTAIMSAAQSMTLQAYKKLLEEQKTDPKNDDLRKGIVESLLIKSLASLAVIEWEGVLEKDSDDPAELNDQNLSDLMDMWIIASDFLKLYTNQFKVLESEGNSSAPSASGISAGVAPTAGSAT